MKTDQNNNNYT